MGRAHVDPLFGFSVNPTGENPPARENEGMRAVPVKNGQFEIAVEGRTGDRLPHVGLISSRRSDAR